MTTPQTSPQPGPEQGQDLTATQVCQTLALDPRQWARARAAGTIPDPDDGRRWSPATVAGLVECRDQIVAAAAELLDVSQLAARIGWEMAEVFRATDARLIPEPDVGRFWTSHAGKLIAAEADRVRALIPEQPIGAGRCADLLTELCGRPVSAIDVEDLADHGHLAIANWFRRWALYDPNEVRALAATDTGRDLIAGHHHLGPDQAAVHLGIRRVDLDHLTAKGWLTPASFIDNRVGRAPIALYRTRDLDQLTTNPALDWPALRTTTPGQRSPVPPHPTGDHQ